MRTLKNILLYGCDLLRVVFVKIPVNLVMTGRGRVVFLIIGALAIFLTGLYFYRSAEIIFLPAPDKVEKEVEVVFKDELVNPVRFIFDAKMYFSAEDFIRDLRPGERVLAGYYKGSFSKPGAEINEADFLVWVKVYYGQTKNGYAVFFDRFPESKYDLRGFRMMNYDQTGITMVEKTRHDDIPIPIWVGGGLVWLMVFFIVLLTVNDY